MMIFHAEFSHHGSELWSVSAAEFAAFSVDQRPAMA
jgi:hypothetical protein